MNKLSVILRGLCTDEGRLVMSLEQLFLSLKDQGFGFLIILFSLPSALPVPAPGYSTIFGLILLWLGSLLVRGRANPTLPKRWQKRSINLSPRMVRGCVRALTFLEHFIHPGRAASLCKCFNPRIVGINICVLACIMILPIPLTNTAPAMVILLFGMGLLENDGLVFLIAQTLTIALVSAYVTIATWILLFGVESFSRFFHG